jgi:hypothetical protein
LGERIAEKVSFPFLYIYYIIYLIDLQILIEEFFRVKKFDCRWKVARNFLDHYRRSYASPCHARSYQGVRPMTYYYVLLVRTIVLSRASALDRP